MQTKTITILVTVLSLLILVIQNSQVVTIRLFFWKIAMSGIILFPLVFILGGLIGALAFSFFKKK